MSSTYSVRSCPIILYDIRGVQSHKVAKPRVDDKWPEFLGKEPWWHLDHFQIHYSTLGTHQKGTTFHFVYFVLKSLYFTRIKINVTDKGEKETCTHLNAEFQRIARRDKKPLLSDQCKEIEENNSMGKLEISSRKLDTKGTFHVTMGSIKDRNGMNLMEAEDIKKRWQEYMEELCKKTLMTQEAMMVWSFT